MDNPFLYAFECKFHDKYENVRSNVLGTVVCFFVWCFSLPDGKRSGANRQQERVIRKPNG